MYISVHKLVTNKMLTTRLKCAYHYAMFGYGYLYIIEHTYQYLCTQNCCHQNTYRVFITLCSTLVEATLPVVISEFSLIATTCKMLFYRIHVHCSLHNHIEK